MKKPPPTDPALTAAARFGLKPKALKSDVRAALAALQIEADSAVREIEALKERLLAAEAMADHDPLIPVLNRRAFLAALQRTIAYAARYGGEAAVLFLDMDDLKIINDQYGHATGDAALRHLGKLLLENVRETDMVGRLGGDEFAIILAPVDAEGARRKMDALSDAMAATPMSHEGVEHVVRASIGMHVIVPTEAAEDALARADEAMYAAKRKTKRTVRA